MADVGETRDPQDRQVVLPERIWNGKIVRNHPELADYLIDVLRTVSAPDHSASDPVYGERTWYYARDVGPSSGFSSS